MEVELTTAVDSIVRARWELRAGQVIPETEDITLGNSGVTLEATVLYADLADSTELALYDQEIAAEVCKAYLVGTTRLIKAAGGEIRSFDGDRVMGVFMGKSKNTSAAKAALKINYFFTKVLEPAFLSFYGRLKDSPFKFAQSVGIDTGEIRAVRAGIRNSNDLVWVGRAPNIAAKLSGIREPDYSTYITEAVYDKLHDSAKLYGGQEMWERCSWANGEPYGTGTVYLLVAKGQGMKVSYAACVVNLTRQQLVPLVKAMEPEGDAEFARVGGQILSYEDVATWLNSTCLSMIGQF